MSDLVQIRKKAQLTIPQSVRQKLGIEEGDFLDIQVRSGEIVLKVKKLIDKEQVWFWTRRWQQGEKEAEEDIADINLNNGKEFLMITGSSPIMNLIFCWNKNN